MDTKTWLETHENLIAEEQIVRWFDYEYMVLELRHIGKLYADAAVELMRLQRGAERAVALRKLLESREAAVRSAISQTPRG